MKHWRERYLKAPIEPEYTKKHKMATEILSQYGNSFEENRGVLEVSVGDCLIDGIRTPCIEYLVDESQRDVLLPETLDGVPLRKIIQIGPVILE